MIKKYDKVMYCVASHLIDTGHVFEYFKDNTNDFFLYVYPSSIKNTETILRYYKNGLVFSERRFFWYTGNSKIIIYIFIFLYFWYSICKFKINNTNIITIHPIFLFFGSFQKYIKKNRLTLWIWDYFPSENYLVKIYNFVLDYYVKHLDNVIFLADGIKYKYINLKKSENLKTVTFGLSQTPIFRNPVPNRLGFVGNLKNGQGFDVMFELIKANPSLTLEVVGDGVIKEILIDKVKEMGISERVIFFGYQSEERLKYISSKWLAGLALYEDTVNNFINFTDPGKVKLYLELEIPVIMTDITYIARLIKKENAGVCVSLDLIEIQGEIGKINNNYNLYQKGITKLKKNLEFNHKYNNDFSFLQKI